MLNSFTMASSSDLVVLEVLIPGTACVPGSINTSLCHTHLSRLIMRRATVLFLLLAGMQKRRQQNHNSNALVLRKKGPGKNCHDCLLGDSVCIIEGSSWQPCTKSLALKSGSLDVKTQRIEITTCAIHPASVAMLPCAPPISSIHVPWSQATNAGFLETLKQT